MVTRRRKSDINRWYGLARMAVMFAGVTGILWFNSTHFDQTEMKALGEIAGLWMGLSKLMPT